MDITELISSDHHEQRRMFALLDDIEPHETDELDAVWSRLRILLEVHAKAEEALFYPRLLDVGEGATDADGPVDETKDALRDHNDIRDGIARVARHPVGDNEWWRAIAATRKANSDHMAEEERTALADFRRHASLQTRHDLAVEFAAFEADHAAGIASRDEDPGRYVEQHT